MLYDKVKNDICKSNEKKKIPKITINERRKIVDKVKQMSKDVHMEIFYFLKKRISEDFTLNQNGVFINLNNISNTTLFELQEMVNFYNRNEKKLKESYLERYCKNKKNKETIRRKEDNVTNKNSDKVINKEVSSDEEVSGDEESGNDEKVSDDEEASSDEEVSGDEEVSDNEEVSGDEEVSSEEKVSDD